jgi:hypothetical protein
MKLKKTSQFLKLAVAPNMVVVENNKNNKNNSERKIVRRHVRQVSQ